MGKMVMFQQALSSLASGRVSQDEDFVSFAALTLLPGLDLGYMRSPICEVAGTCPRAAAQSLRLGMPGQRLEEQLRVQPHRGAISDQSPLSAGQGPFE